MLLQMMTMAMTTLRDSRRTAFATAPLLGLFYISLFLVYLFVIFQCLMLICELVCCLHYFYLFFVTYGFSYV